ncbi:spermine oxidase-like isoform X1 [Haliotis rufescens]|uniref:spermine oxidase-like isoform X1 n=2 Tax=Haliotis rufescens TaxID=6454 RepID=UPI001EAFAA40|nr:spermine oxidase-like isoform X1 [Haliotis rufescens]
MALRENEGQRVIIVGGGIAGLTAASHLINNGVTNVTLLEAQERLGGRIHTVKFGESVLDLGAQWIHGLRGNCVYELAKKHDLVGEEQFMADVSTRSRLHEFEGYLFLTSKGEEVDMKTVHRMIGIWDEIYHEAEEFFSTDDESESDDSSESDSESSSDKDGGGTEKEKSHFKARDLFPCGQTPKSFGEYFDRCFQHFMMNNKGDSEDERNLQKAFAEWQKQFENVDNACSSLHELNLRSWGKYFDCDGDRATEFKNGFKSLLDVIIEKIPSQSIYLSKPVKTVHWQTSNEECQGSGSNEKSVIECEDGKVFKADYVVMTPSVGVLKEREGTLFDPSLPEEKKYVLRNMGYGTVNKIFLEWETRFWDENCFGIQLLWLDNVPVQVKSAKSKIRTKSGEAWYEKVQGFDCVINQPTVLEMFVSGEKAEIMEALDDQEVMDVCVELLTTFTKLDVPTPTRILRTFWNTNPYFRGAYSLITPDLSLADHDILREPLPSREAPVLLFAGEACSKHHFTTTHGAMESGKNAAKIILKDLKKLHKEEDIEK